MSVRRFAVVLSVVLTLIGVAAPALAQEDPLCVVQPQWCEN